MHIKISSPRCWTGHDFFLSWKNNPLYNSNPVSCSNAADSAGAGQFGVVQVYRCRCWAVRCGASLQVLVLGSSVWCKCTGGGAGQWGVVQVYRWSVQLCRCWCSRAGAGAAVHVIVCTCKSAACDGRCQPYYGTRRPLTKLERSQRWWSYQGRLTELRDVGSALNWGWGSECQSIPS